MRPFATLFWTPVHLDKYSSDELAVEVAGQQDQTAGSAALLGRQEGGR